MFPDATSSVLIFRILKGFKKIMITDTRYCNKTKKHFLKNNFKKILPLVLP